MTSIPVNTTFKKLDYSIHKCSSFSTSYTPENIKENRSNDQSSRWTSDSNNPPQYLILKLHQPAIVKTITFGKYEQTHVCNLKKFKIFGGMDESSMMELLEGGLKNDSIPETFPLRHALGDGNFPIRYIQIMPLLSWGSSFNFSIWFVELNGEDDYHVVDAGIKHLKNFKEKEIIRLCLKHFREKNYTLAMKALEEQTGIQLEDPHITRLHEILVQNGDFVAAEKFIEQSVQDGYFQSYVNNQEYTPYWQPVSPTNIDPETKPGMRGGHQMCVDPYTETIYLLGGWDGNQDLSDLWAYSIATNKWTLLCREAELMGGPTPRSCHKMCLDTKRQQLFTFGRYLDTLNRSPESLKSDFYMYDIEANRWTQITSDTAAMGGPQLIYDHQMCMDVENRTLYIFGGRTLMQSSNDMGGGQMDAPYSGLYSYQVSTNTWTHLLTDFSYMSSPGIPAIRSRVGHSMLFHTGSGKLYVFGGQRSKEYLNDFFTFDVYTKQVMQEGCRTDIPGSIPPPGFTQRATIDVERNEIYVLSGLSKEKDKRDDNIQNSFWVYYITQQKWKCIYKNENSGENYWRKMLHIEPCPRFAHQLVYDHVKKVHYLFGGNPGRMVSPQLRLDDFWQLRLCKPTAAHLLQQCRLHIRKYHFREMAHMNSLQALEYLQTTLYEVIDHSDKQQTQEFQALASELFCDNALINNSASSNSSTLSGSDVMEQQPSILATTITTTTNKCNSGYFHRSQLFEQLMNYFPENMRQPKGNLSELLQL